MKVFTVKKEKEENLEEKLLDRISYFNFKEKNRFNYIIIENPSNSSKIYTIKDIEVLNKDNSNELCLMQGEASKEEKLLKVKITDKLGELNIATGIEENNNNVKTELVRNTLPQGRKYNILDESVLILLPGGCLFIKLKKEVQNLDIDVSWTSDDI